MNQPFDLAFGLAPQVIAFAASFTDRKTLCWLDWEDWMITGSDGLVLPIMRPAVFRGAFSFILTQYFARTPNGKLKFNLQDMTSGFPQSLTVWELEMLSREYRQQMAYYQLNPVTGAFVELTEFEQAQQLHTLLR
jgi:hypothetical protein